jgi:catechol 2,3-dioxygenase-like lactoylglutathione lyase family enzyme
MKAVGIHHVAICVSDVDDALDFYCDKLGFTKITERPDFGFPGAWVRAGANQIHLMQIADVRPDQLQHFALQVADLDRAVEELQAAGVEVNKSPYTPGAGHQAFIRDPSGNGIELNQPDG